jgi:hypothetical protein
VADVASYSPQADNGFGLASRAEFKIRAVIMPASRRLERRKPCWGRKSLAPTVIETLAGIPIMGRELRQLATPDSETASLANSKGLAGDFYRKSPLVWEPCTYGNTQVP